MSLIFPAGSRNHSWYPKVAENDNIGMDAISDRELEDLAEGDVEEIEGGDLEVSDEADEVVDDSFGADDLGEGAEGDLESKVEDAQIALDEASVKLEEVSIELSGDDLGEEGFDDVDGTVEVCEEGEICEEGEGAIDVLVEEVVMEPETEGSTCCSCGSPMPTASAKGETKTASSQKGLVAIAKLSSENKKRLGTYWKNMLGYSPEYVNAMLTDYEK